MINFTVSWIKVNTMPLCFGTRDDKYGSFTITQAGEILVLKLTHLFGTLVCFNGRSPSFWGCQSERYGDKTLMTYISHANERRVILPRRAGVEVGGPWRSVGKCKHEMYTYKISGENDTSPEIIFDTTSEPLRVSHNQQFWIWFGQDIADCSEENNEGESCVDVYGWYK